jgi:flagellar basal-body rod protein FlgF
MRARQNTIEAQANNIANASTAGFKAERLVYSTFESDKKAVGDRQNLVAGVSTSSGVDFREGSLQQTGRSLDVAIDGDAFLQVQTPRGVRFTRAGNLTVSDAGQLITKNGDMVVGDRGPITVPQDGELSIGENGSMASRGQVVDSLKLVRFNNPTTALIKEGDNLFIASGSEPPQQNVKAKIIQGSLEGSNINSITEMVQMINNSREFDSLGKSLSVLKDIGRISGDIGKL